MFTLCFVASFWYFCLSFVPHFLIYFAPLMHHLLPLFISSFLSLIPLDSFVYLWQKGGEYTGVFCHFYITHVHILRERNSISCTFIGGENYKGDAYIKGENTSFWENLVLSCFTLCLFSRCFIVLWVTFSIYALLLLSHRVYVLDMHTFLCYCALLVACSNNHFLCYMIIVVISTWLFCVWPSCSYVLQHVFLIICLLVILYLSFYHLIYFEGLMCFVQVFQVTGIHVSSSLQLLELGVSEFYHCS